MSLFTPIEHFDNFPHSESTFGTRLSLFMLACSKGQTKQTFIPLHYGVKTFMKLYLNNLNYIYDFMSQLKLRNEKFVLVKVKVFREGHKNMKKSPS